MVRHVLSPFKAQWFLYVTPNLTLPYPIFCPHSVFVSSVWYVDWSATIPYLYTPVTGWFVQCSMCLLWSRSWDFKCLLHRRRGLHLLQRRCDPIMRKGVSRVQLPPNRARCLRHRAQDRRFIVIWHKSVAVWGHADGIHWHVIGKSRTPGTCILEFRNVCLRERRRGCVCACIWCVGGMWRRVTFGQLADSSWHLYKKSVVFSWIDRLIGLHFFYKEPG